MTFRIRRHLVGAALTALAMAPALAQSPGETRAGGIVVGDAWARATPAGARVGAAYGSIQNRGQQPDRLVAAEVQVAGQAELHQTVVEGGVARMLPSQALDVPAGSTVQLQPGGFHLMLTGLKQPLKEGERFAGTLVFEKAGRVPVEFAVRGLSAGGSHGGHSAH